MASDRRGLSDQKKGSEHLNKRFAQVTEPRMFERCFPLISFPLGNSFLILDVSDPRGSAGIRSDPQMSAGRANSCDRSRSLQWTPGVRNERNPPPLSPLERTWFMNHEPHEPPQPVRAPPFFSSPDVSSRAPRLARQALWIAPAWRPERCSIRFGAQRGEKRPLQSKPLLRASTCFDPLLYTFSCLKFFRFFFSFG